jgi:hypothetical protein
VEFFAYLKERNLLPFNNLKNLQQRIHAADRRESKWWRLKDFFKNHLRNHPERPNYWSTKSPPVHERTGGKHNQSKNKEVIWQ